MKTHPLGVLATKSFLALVQHLIRPERRGPQLSKGTGHNLGVKADLRRSWSCCFEAVYSRLDSTLLRPFVAYSRQGDLLPGHLDSRPSGNATFNVNHGDRHELKESRKTFGTREGLRG